MVSSSDNELPPGLVRLIREELGCEFDNSRKSMVGPSPSSSEYRALREQYIEGLYCIRIAGLRSFPSSFDSLCGRPFFVDGDDFLNPDGLSVVDQKQREMLMDDVSPSVMSRLWYGIRHPSALPYLFSRKKRDSGYGDN